MWEGGASERQVRSLRGAISNPELFRRPLHQPIDPLVPARNVRRGTPVYPLGPSKDVCTGMHRASLRVIIPVPEVGDANKSEGGAIVGVWVHTSG